MSSATYFSTAITQEGLDFIKSAYPTGPLIEVAYFIPVYDYRIDPTIQQNGVALSAFSAVAQETAVTSANVPFGEKIWRINSDGYSLSDNTNILVSAIAGTYQSSPERLTNTKQTNKPVVGINLYNGIPLTNHVSAGTMNYDSVSDVWNIVGYSTVSGSNLIPISGSQSANSYYRVTANFPVYESSGGGGIRGSFTCRINQDVGRFKFNKVAMYAVRRNKDGTFYGGDGTPKFFAEGYIHEPVFKTNFGADGIDDITMNFQLNIASVTSAFTNVFYSTSGDYWYRSMGGLQYPLKVGIGTFEDVGIEPKAALHIRRTRTSGNNLEDLSIPQLRIDNSNKQWFSIEQRKHDPETSSVYQGEILLTTYNMCGIAASDTDIITSAYGGKKVHLGTSAYPFGRIYLSQPQTQGAVHINLNQIVLGDLTTSTDAKGIELDDLGVYIKNSSTKYGRFDGGDLARRYSDLLIYSYCGTGDSSVPHVRIGAGVNILSITNDINIHNELKNAFENDNTLSWSKFADNGILSLVGRGGIKVRGPLDLDVASYWRSQYGDIDYDYGIVKTDKSNLLIINGLNPDFEYGVNGIADILWGDLDFCGITNETNNKQIWLVADTLKTEGDLIPTKNSEFNIGSLTRIYNNVYVKDIYEKSRSVPMGEWIDDINNIFLSVTPIVGLIWSNNSFFTNLADVAISVDFSTSGGTYAKYTYIGNTKIYKLMMKVDIYNYETNFYDIKVNSLTINGLPLEYKANVGRGANALEVTNLVGSVHYGPSIHALSTGDSNAREINKVPNIYFTLNTITDNGYNDSSRVKVMFLRSDALPVVTVRRGYTETLYISMEYIEIV